MEDSSNGKIEETQKVETEEEYNEEVIVKEVEGLKQPDAAFPVREDVIDGNSETVIEETPDGINDDDFGSEYSSRSSEEETEEKSPQMEEEEMLINSVVESAEFVSPLPDEAPEEKSKDSDVHPEAEITTTFEEKTFISANHTTDIPPDVKEKVSDGDDETPFIQQTPPEAVSDESDKRNPLSCDEEDGYSSKATEDACKGIEGKTLQSSDENGEVSADVASRGIEESTLAPPVTENCGEPKNVDESSKPVGSKLVVGSSDGYPESTGNTPIISLRQRTTAVQPTSWKSCCGLFEVLRRSN